MVMLPFKMPSDPLLARDWNEIVERLRSDLNIHGGQGIEVLHGPGGLTIALISPVESFLARVVTEGPEDSEGPQPDWSDERYWVKELHIVNSGHQARIQYEDLAATDARWVTATNIPELGLAPEERHLITRPDYLIDPVTSLPYVRPYDCQHVVWVWAVGDPRGRVHYLFNSFMPQIWETYIKQVTWRDADDVGQGAWNLVRFCVILPRVQAPPQAASSGEIPGTSSGWEPPTTTETYSTWASYTYSYTPSSSTTMGPYPPSFTTSYPPGPPPSGETEASSEPPYSPSETSSEGPYSQFDHPCCPDYAPVHFRFKGTNFSDNGGVTECSFFNRTVTLTWDGMAVGWYWTDGDRAHIMLKCDVVGDENHWWLVTWIDQIPPPPKPGKPGCGCEWHWNEAHSELYQINTCIWGAWGAELAAGDPDSCGDFFIWPLGVPPIG